MAKGIRLNTIFCILDIKCIIVTKPRDISEVSKQSSIIGIFKEEKNINDIIHDPRKGIGRIIM